MIALRDVQASFVAAILSTGASPERLVPNYISCASNDAVDRHRKGFFSGLSKILACHFPAVQRIIGSGMFSSVAREYIRSQMPTSPVMSQYGESFPCFLNQCSAVPDRSCLSDVAQLEWACLRTYHACDAHAVLPIELAQLPRSTLDGSLISLNPTARIICSPYPIVSIWKAVIFDAHTGVRPRTAASECALVVRPALEVRVVPLSIGDQSFLRALRAGLSFCEASNYASAREGGFNCSKSFASLLSIGAFSAMELRHRRSKRIDSGLRSEIRHRTLH